MLTTPAIGQPLNRLEGELKVTGAAKYAAEYNVPDLLFGYILNSTITKGKITAIHTEEAMALPGVVDVFSHLHRPHLPWLDLKYADMDAPPGTVFRPLYDGDIKYNGQPIGLLVAESFELARYAASLVRVEYEEEPFVTKLKDGLPEARSPKTGMATALKPLPPPAKGDFEAAFESSFAKASGKFFHGTEHHNPLEMFATTTVYEGEGKLTIYDKTQGTINSQIYVANIFGLHYKDVQVIAPYVGGAFGSGLRPQYQLFLCAMAALELKRNVRVVMERHHMFTFGHRPPTIQMTRFGADADGKVDALYHGAWAETSRFEDYTEVVVNWANMLYPAKNTQYDYKVVELDVYSPLDMRAPGGSTGMHAIESTMDALAYELNMDPLELRLRNYSEKDVSVGRPFSSKELRECYLQGAEKFGWSGRSPEPRSMRRGNKLVGYGMATGLWEANRLFARATAIMTPEGKLIVESAVTDIGTGTLTVMTQIAADAMGLPVSDVVFRYGDSKMPFAPIQGGSWTVSTVGPAVQAAAKALKKKLLKKAVGIDGSPLNDASMDDVEFRDGAIVLKSSPATAIAFKEIIAANKGKAIKTTNTAMPNPLKLKRHSRAAHSAVFVEVEVDEQLGTINVTRALTAVAGGRIINPKTARSQILGGMVWSISKALREETITDFNLGKYMNPNLAEYHIPVHADIHELDVLFIEETETVVNELGTKGLGEIGLVGMPPAIANAIFHATGKRVNQFPILLDKLL